MKDIDKEVEPRESDGMGRHAKIGLALIASLLVVFVVVLIVKVNGPDEKAAADGKGPGRPPAPRSTDPNGAAANGPWAKPRASSDRPVVASPKTESPRSLKPPRARSRPSVPDDTQDLVAASGSPEPLIMPAGSASSAGARTLPPAPANAWSNGTGTITQAPPAPVPDNRYDPAVGRGPAPSPGYPSSQGGYASNGPAYSGYPSDQSTSGWSTAASRPEPTSSGNVGPYSAAYPPYSPGPRDDYPRRDHASNTGRTEGRDGYREAPYSEKLGRPHHMPNRVSPGYSTDDSYGYNDGGPSGGGSLGSYGALGGRRDNGEYVVGPNDSFWTISERLYGTGAYFRALAQINKKPYPDRDSLRPGDIVLAPEPAELEDKYPDLCPSPERRKVLRDRMLPVSSRTSYHAGPVYSVQEGDTLYDIARFKLGNGSRWPEIYELNLDALQGDFNYLTPGMELVLPDQPADTVTRRPGSDSYGR